MAGERTYRLRFVRDLCDIPLDKLDDCLTDLRCLILAVHAMDLKLDEFSCGPAALPDEIEWLDDGDRSATVHVRAESEPLFDVRIGPARPAPSSTETTR